MTSKTVDSASPPTVPLPQIVFSPFPWNKDGIAKVTNRTSVVIRTTEDETFEGPGLFDITPEITYSNLHQNAILFLTGNTSLLWDYGIQILNKTLSATGKYCHFSLELIKFSTDTVTIPKGEDLCTITPVHLFDGEITLNYDDSPGEYMIDSCEPPPDTCDCGVASKRQKELSWSFDKEYQLDGDNFQFV